MPVTPRHDETTARAPTKEDGCGCPMADEATHGIDGATCAMAENRASQASDNCNHMREVRLGRRSRRQPRCTSMSSVKLIGSFGRQHFAQLGLAFTTGTNALRCCVEYRCECIPTSDLSLLPRYVELQRDFVGAFTPQSATMRLRPCRGPYRGCTPSRSSCPASSVP
jgi:hypothetical protein